MAIDRGWRTLREQQAEKGTKAVFDELPICQVCNDHGYVTIKYPSIYSAIRVCNCKAAHDRFGADTFEEINSRSEKDWWDDMRFYFGGANRQETKAIMDQYELVKRPDKYPKCEVIMEYKRKGVQR